MGIARKYRRVIEPPRRPTLAGLILEKVGQAGEVLLESFFPATYPQARLWRKFLGLDAGYEFLRPTFKVILSQLKAQGLISKVRRRGRTYWRIMPMGEKAIAEHEAALLPRSDGKKRLVCFDIPERERAKRRWLRQELLALGYRQLQKSVWVGERPLPSDFLAELDTLNLRGRVQILAVASEGTRSPP